MHVASFYVPEGDDDSKKTLPKSEILFLHRGVLVYGYAR
jgi:hypothetical protein